MTITASFNGTSARVNITIQRHAWHQTTSGDDVLSEPEARNLSCLPRSVSAGGDVSCELRVTASAEPQPLDIQSTSQGVRVPARVVARPNQTRLTFRASIDPMAKQQMAVITATSGDTQVQDTVAVAPAQGPVLRVAPTHLVRLGEPLRFVAGAADPAGLPFQLSAEGLPGGAVRLRPTLGAALTPRGLRPTPRSGPKRLPGGNGRPSPPPPPAQNGSPERIRSPLAPPPRLRGLR